MYLTVLAIILRLDDHSFVLNKLENMLERPSFDEISHLDHGSDLDMDHALILRLGGILERINRSRTRTLNRSNGIVS